MFLPCWTANRLHIALLQDNSLTGHQVNVRRDDIRVVISYVIVAKIISKKEDNVWLLTNSMASQESQTEERGEMYMFYHGSVRIEDRDESGRI